MTDKIKYNIHVRMLKLSDFFKTKIKPFIYGTFLSRIMDTSQNGQNYFYCYSRFRTSKYVSPNEFNIKEYVQNQLIDEFNHFSYFCNWKVYKLDENEIELRFYILNDLNIPKQEFYKKLYSSLINERWINTSVMNEQQKEFIRGFMESRGSVDTSRKFIAQDYFYNNKLELKKAMILIDMMNLPIEYANFNMRELQPQFISGENRRNAQFRINAFYYANKIGFINKYKAKIFQNAYSLGNWLIRHDNEIQYFSVDASCSRNNDSVFIRYLNFFSNNIYQQKLNSSTIRNLRERLGFHNSEFNIGESTNRNRNLIQLFNEIAPDKCAVCGRTTTFTNKTTGRQYFEVHHVISYYNDHEVDNIGNLVKLCPICHDMLKRGLAPEDLQINAILKILNEYKEVYEFTSTYLGIEDIDELSKKIWSLLG